MKFLPTLAVGISCLFDFLYVHLLNEVSTSEMSEKVTDLMQNTFVVLLL